MKETLILGAVEDRLVSEVNSLAHRWHCAAAQVTGWDESEELFTHHEKKVRHAYNLIGKNRLPWYKLWELAEEKTLAQLWKEFKDEEKDPEYAKHLKEVREDLESRVRDTESESSNMASLHDRQEAEKERQRKLIERRRRR